MGASAAAAIAAIGAKQADSRAKKAESKQDEQAELVAKKTKQEEAATALAKSDVAGRKANKPGSGRSLLIATSETGLKKKLGE